jgi:hypothetical protein
MSPESSRLAVVVAAARLGDEGFGAAAAEVSALREKSTDDSLRDPVA